MRKINKLVKEILIGLLQDLAPDNMPRYEVSKLVQATGLSESTIRMAKKRESLSADTLIRLLLTHGVDPKDILNLPRKNVSRVCSTLTQWNKFGFQLNRKEREAYMQMIEWNQKRFKLK